MDDDGSSNRRSNSVVEKYLMKATAEAEDRVKKDNLGLYDQSLHATKEPIKFTLVKKFPQGMPWVPVKGDEEKPNNGRLTFVMLLKGNQEPRMRQIARGVKDTNGLTKHLGRNAWMMEMQSSIKVSDSREVKRQKERTIEAVFTHGSMMLSLGQAQVPGLRNINYVHHLRQVDKQGNVRVIKKNMVGVLDYLR